MITGSEKLASGELESLTREVVASGVLLDFTVEGKEFQEQLRSNMALNATSLDKFLTALSEGLYDSQPSRSKVHCVYIHFHRALDIVKCSLRGRLC